MKMAARWTAWTFICFLTVTTEFYELTFAGLISGSEKSDGKNDSVIVGHRVVFDSYEYDDESENRTYASKMGEQQSSSTTTIAVSDIPVACNASFDAVTYLYSKNELLVFISKYYWSVSGNGSVSKRKKIRNRWNTLPEDLTHVDAVYERFDYKITFFIGKQIYVFDVNNLLLMGYPKPLTSLGLPETLDKLDAAMVWGQHNRTYFFSGTMFWRFDEEEGRVDRDYPRDMGVWKGIGYNIDSAFTLRDGITYFVKGRGFWTFNNYKMQVQNSEPTSFAKQLTDCSGVITESPPAVVTVRTQISNCILPAYPLRGIYTTNVPNAKPGEAYDLVVVNVTCQEGYRPNGPSLIYCYNGQWASLMPQCVSLCQLPLEPSVEYRCLVSLDWMDGFRTCNEFEPAGTLVRPFCKTHYYSTTTLKYMHCIDGEWSNIQKCTPECGTLIPNGTQLVLGGETANLGEVPWHAGIYKKTTEAYEQICGGSIISKKTVISAAHCFWSDLLGKLPASEYAVAVGKLHREWNSSLDKSQWSDVESVNIPVHFRGSVMNYQADVAVVLLITAIEYNTYIRPVCLDFDFNFEQRQLQPHNKGKVAGWGLAAENGGPSQLLRVVDLPYVSVQTCIDGSPPVFTPLITSDKACAGYNNGSAALCKGDSGGGLAFPALDRSQVRYYLRGVASTAPPSENLCNAYAYISFTRLTNHEPFITRFWGD